MEPNKLSDEERTRLKKCEAVIEANLESTTEYLRPFIDSKGWLPMFDSFEDYCKAVYGWDAEITKAVLIVTGLAQ